jgi:hypothetical protein
VIEDTHPFVPWLCVEDHIGLFLHQPGPKKQSVHPSVRKKRLYLKVELRLIQAIRRTLRSGLIGFVGSDFFVR